MSHADRLNRITRRARLVYRIRLAVEGGLIVGIVAAASSFVVMLLVGLGYLTPAIWKSLAIGSAVGVVGGSLLAALRRLNDHSVLQRVDHDHGLQNALTTARQFLLGQKSEAPDPLVMAHVRQSLERAENMVFARSVTANLGARARILGILCVCILSVAFI